MSDSAIPTGKYKGATASTDKVYTTQGIDDYMRDLGIDCPFDIEVREPCKEIDDEPITFDLVSHRIIRGWIGFQLLRFSIWLGDFRMTKGE